MTRIRNPKPKYVTIPVDLGPELTAAVRKLAHRNGISPNRQLHRLITQQLALR